MKNIIIGEFKHETNSFSSIPADETAYKSRLYLVGNELFSFKGLKTELGAFLDVLGPEEDISLIPTAALDAMPSGPVTAEMYRFFRDRVMKAIDQSEHVDGVLLAMHGAMVTELSPDGEGSILEEIRQKVGPDVPIMASLDLHTNITQKMIRNASALCTYKGYPHIDIYETGLRIAQIMLKTLQGEVKPVMAYRKLPLLMPLIPTASSAISPLYEQEKGYYQIPGVLNVDIAYGFFHADIDEGGSAIIAITDGDAKKAQQIADELGRAMWNRRKDIRIESTDLDEAIDQVLSMPSGEVPCTFADMSDNPGGGGTTDTTHILRRLLERGVKNTAIATINDPEAVQKAVAAGVGNTITLDFGGKADPATSGTPIHATAYVKAITDGTYINKDKMNTGFRMRMGTSAVLQFHGIDVILSSIRAQHYEPEVFRSCSITPEDKALLVVKSSIHFRHAYQKISKHIFNIIVPGAQMPTPESYSYKSHMSQMYPLNKAAEMD